MKPITVTFVSTYSIKNGEPSGDIFQKIVAIGYNETEAKTKALDELMHTCCNDFTTPASCKTGINVDYFAANGYRLEDGESIDDAEEKFNADSVNLDYVVDFDFEGVKYIFPDNFSEYTNGGSILSDNVKHFDSWGAVYNWLGINN